MASHSSTPKSPFARLAELGTRRLAIIGGALVVVIAVVLAVTLSGSTPTGKHQHGTTTTTSGTPTSSSSTSTTVPRLASDVCPLTDTPAPGGVVPRRPALAVKIGNEPEGARPQSGLNEADIVYDTPAEGGIMRYEAVYQCNGAAQVGPIRSLRWVDWHIMAMFRNLPLLVHAGGITPDLNDLDSLRYVKDVNLLGNSAKASANFPDLGIRTSNRVPPDNLYTSTKVVWAAFSNEKKPPLPVFAYSASLPASAQPASSLQINYSYETDPIWTWSAADHLWLHSYAGEGPDIDTLDNRQVSTTNIVVQVVHYGFGPYLESPNGTGDVESIMTGSGSGWIFRNGKEIPITWHRAILKDDTTFTDAAGQPVGLAPGRTWVEIVLDTTAKSPGAITITK